MNGINLIPAQRIAAKRRRARVRLWMSIAPVCVSVLAGSYGYLFASWETDRSEVNRQIEQADAEIKRAERQLSAERAKLAEANARLRAAEAVSNQPDWGLLLRVLAANLGEDAVLSGCVLESAPISAGKPAAARPEAYRLVLAGMARTQAAVPALVRRLEDTGLFESAKMVEATRMPFAGAEAFKFQVECAMADSAGEGR